MALPSRVTSEEGFIIIGDNEKGLVGERRHAILSSSVEPPFPSVHSSALWFILSTRDHALSMLQRLTTTERLGRTSRHPAKS